MKMTDAFKPSILLDETHFAYRTAKGVFADAVARVADEGFYRGVSIFEVSDASDRRRIGKIVQSHELTLTQWMSMVLATENLNLSSLDETVRSKSVARIKDYMEQGVECGASDIAVLSGPDPGPAIRTKATECLYRSLCELCQALSTFDNMNLTLEPLDREADKKGLIGPTKEAVALIQRVRKSFPDIDISWDTAHSLLCGEDLIESLAAVRPYLTQIHLANPVLDRSCTDFGDAHIPLGAPGLLDIETVDVIFRKAIEMEIFVSHTPCVAVEIRTPNGSDPWETEALGRETLQKAWDTLQSAEIT